MVKRTFLDEGCSFLVGQICKKLGQLYPKLSYFYIKSMDIYKNLEYIYTKSMDIYTNLGFIYTKIKDIYKIRDVTYQVKWNSTKYERNSTKFQFILQNQDRILQNRWVILQFMVKISKTSPITTQITAFTKHSVLNHGQELKVQLEIGRRTSPAAYCL